MKYLLKSHLPKVVAVLALLLLGVTISFGVMAKREPERTRVPEQAGRTPRQTAAGWWTAHPSGGLKSSPRLPMATINVAAGDTAGLIAAINTANNEISNPGPDTIVLAGGTYTLTAINNYQWGPNGIPAITSHIIIEGNGAIIERSAAALTPNFRLFFVERVFDVDFNIISSLTLKNVLLRNGLAQGGNGGNSLTGGGGGGGAGVGGAILNFGGLIIENSTLVNNIAKGGNGGGIGGDGGGGGGGGGVGGNGGDAGGIGSSLREGNRTSAKALGFGGSGGGGGFRNGWRWRRHHDQWRQRLWKPWRRRRRRERRKRR